MKRLTVLISLFLLASVSFSQSSEIHEDWIKNDSIFINNLKEKYLANPLSIEKVLKPNKKEFSNLGYGYSLIEESNGKGYVSIFYTLVYKDKKLISYRLKPEMPSNSELISRYLRFYQGMFETSSIAPSILYYNYQQMTLPAFNLMATKDNSSGIQYFMTPYSDIRYGNYGGIASAMLENRKAYNSIKNLIDEDLLILLLHAINPASRLSAAEFYYQNREKFKQHDLIESLIIKNLKELPNIVTMNGCFVITENAKKVLDQMINENN